MNLNDFGLIPHTSKTLKAGDRFGRLTVLATGKLPGTYRYQAVCQCDCQSPIRAVRFDSLRKGLTTSCGCFHRDQHFKHGLTGHPLANVYRHMMDRCYNPSSPAFSNYGGRGIAVCERWHNPLLFREDVEPLYQKGLEMDRINNDGNYELSNIRFVTRSENCDNRRTAQLLTHKGETKSIKQWATEYKIRYHLLWDRIVTRKWDAEKALNTPPLNDKERMAIARESRTRKSL